MLKIVTLLFKYSCIFSACGASSTLPFLYSTGGTPQVGQGKLVDIEITSKKKDDEVKGEVSRYSVASESTTLAAINTPTSNVSNTIQQATHLETKEKEENVQEKKSELENAPSQFDSKSKTISLKNREEGIGDYREFIENLVTVMRSGIPWYKPYEDLWIDKVFVTMPAGKFTDSSILLKKKTESYAHLSPTFNREVDNSKTIDVFDFDIHEIYLRQNKPTDRGWAALTEIEKMANLIQTFLHKDWIEPDNKEGETKQSFNYDDVVLAYMELKDAGVDPAEYGPDRTRHVLRFVRIYEGRYYYCDIYFNGQKGNALIRSHYMYYRDQTWRSGGYYQPNGSYASVRNHIGGDKEAADKQWYTWTEIDESVSSIFKTFKTKPKNTWMWFKILAEAVKDREASETFLAPYYLILPQLENSISRENSGEEEYYKRIHPLSRQYYKIKESGDFRSIGKKTDWASLVTLDSLGEISSQR